MVYVLAVLVLLFAPVSSPSVDYLDLPIDADKLAHFGLMGGLAFLEFWRIRAGDLERFSAAVMWAAGVAGTTEAFQALLPYRSGDWLDFFAGAAGGLLGAAVAWGLRRMLYGPETVQPQP